MGSMPNMGKLGFADLGAPALMSSSGHLQGQACTSLWPASILREIFSCEVGVGSGIPEHNFFKVAILYTGLPSPSLKKRQRSS